MKNKFKGIYVKWALSALWWIALLSTAFLLISVLSAKLKGQVPSVFGYSVMRIISGSMEPEIPTGTYILIRKCYPEDVMPGQIISFYSEDPVIYGIPNTHRVIALEESADGVLFVTKGDANLGEDSVRVKADRLIGIYACPLPWLTDFSNALDGGMMPIFLIVLQLGTVIVIAGSIVRKRVEGEQKDSTESS